MHFYKNFKRKKIPFHMPANKDTRKLMEEQLFEASL